MPWGVDLRFVRGCRGVREASEEQEMQESLQKGNAVTRVINSKTELERDQDERDGCFGSVGEVDKVSGTWIGFGASDRNWPRLGFRRRANWSAVRRGSSDDRSCELPQFNVIQIDSRGLRFARQRLIIDYKSLANARSRGP